MRASINDAGSRVIDLDGDKSAIITTIAGYLFAKGKLMKFSDALSEARKAVDTGVYRHDETCQIFINY